MSWDSINAFFVRAENALPPPTVKQIGGFVLLFGAAMILGALVAFSLNRLFNGAFLLVLGYLLLERKCPEVGHRGTFGLVLLFFAFGWIGGVLDILIEEGGSRLLALIALIVVVLNLVGIALVRSGYRNALVASAQQPNQPLHPDASRASALSAGERRR